MRTAASFLLALLALGGCTAGSGGLTRVEPTCLVLFRNYDTAVQVFGYTDRDRDGGISLMVPTAVDRAGQRLRENGCLTSEDDLSAAFRLTDEDVAAVLQGENGASIAPISVSAGIVLGIASEVQARQFFGAAGIRVRSIGAPGLGRRIYLGPFATEGGLAAAIDLAERAGFVAPYPARFR